MNKIFNIVWCKALRQLVVASELSHRSSGGSVSRPAATRRAPALSLTALAAALFFCIPAPAAAARLAMPSGAILDINNGTAANSASNTANTFQNYTVSFTATTTGNNYILFAFRQDPAYWTFGDVGLYAAGDTSTNLFTNPLFTTGGEIQGSGVQAPANWGVVYQAGTTPDAAGTWHAPGSSGVSTTNVNANGAGSWYDGAVGSFDGIYQGVDLVAGITYTINFTALSNQAANTAGAANGGNELGVFAGTCVTLTGPVGNCVPNNPGFSVLATPGEAANAGGPSSTPVTSTSPSTTSDVGTTDIAFDGGTLTVDQSSPTVTGNATITGNGGTIDQSGHASTFTGTFTDETSGTPGSLSIVNSGTGGSVTLTAENTYTGTTSVDTGATLSLSGDGSIASSSGLTNNGTFDITQANHDETITTLAGTGTVNLGGNDLRITNGSTTFSGSINGAGGVDLTGGTQTFTGTSTYTGGTTVNNATVAINNGSALGTGIIALQDATLVTTAPSTLNNDVVVTGISTVGTTNAGDTLTLNGDISGAGHLNIAGGTTVLGGDNTYAGGTSAGSGTTLAITNTRALGTGTLNLEDSTLATQATGTLSNDIMLAHDGGIVDTAASTLVTHTGNVSGTGDYIKNGSGSLVETGTLNQVGATVVNGGYLTLSGANTYTGGTTINGGVLYVTSDANLGAASGGITLNGGALAIADGMSTLRNVDLASTSAIAVISGSTATLGGTVSGNGGLVKDEAGTLQLDGVASHAGGTTVNDGTLILNGANTYTGGTTLNGGTLQISADANLGDASNGIHFNGGSLHTTGSFTTGRALWLDASGSIATDANTTVVATGTISGAAGLVKNGAGMLDISGVASHAGGTTVNDGTLILSGNNTYTGGNTLNGGTLQISADANLGDASNGIHFEGGSLHTTGSFTTGRGLWLDTRGSIATDANTTVVATGTISGTAGLVKNGAGTLDISGVASHAGGTTVNDGTLILSGNNTYTGGNTLNGGVLQISMDANLGAASNEVTFNGGTLSVTQSNTTARNWVIEAGGAVLNTANGVTLQDSGNISGMGGLVKLGGGTLVVSGNNSFTGGTLIQGGVIRIDSGSSLGTGAIVLNGGILQTVQTLGTGQKVIISGTSGVNVDAGTTTVLSGSLVAAAGDACFTKTGKGKLSLTGSANLASGTCVQDGILSANGVLDSSYVQVDSGAMLRGIGYVRGPVNVDGTLAAGNSPGTLTIQGPVTMKAASTLEVDIDGLGTGTGAGNYSRVLVTGAGNTFVANGTLAPTLRGITGDASNTYTPDIGASYRIVSAEGGIVGRFTTLAQPASGLAAKTRFLAFYGTNGGQSIDLRVAPTSYAAYLTGSAKRNDIAAAAALDGSVASLDGATDTAAQDALLYAVSSLSGDRIAALAKSLSGEVHADEAAAARAAGLGMQRDVADHLSTDAESTDAAHRVWANVTRDGNRSVADNQGSGFETGTDRSTIGFDVYAEGGTVLGVAGTHHDTNVISHGGNGSIRGTSGMLYAQQALGGFLLDGVAAYGNTDWTTRRADPLGGAWLSSRTSGNDAMASVSLRLPTQTASGNRIEPYASVIWQKVERDGVNERGGSVAALALDDLSQKGTRVLAGVTMGSKSADPLATTLTWRAGVAVGADTGDLLDPTVHNTLAGQRFDTAAPSVGRGFVQVNANGTMRLAESTYLYGGITAEEGQRRSAYGVTAGVRVAF
ncbi:MAG: autotransporter-associated beta strand repeat-containing protein [Luteibacter sp.]|uniref:autotransporter-associated beta strand repeat-containing protein n=1 Tax=Luteibacter sp. TaxID=1886636 RepID=UPI0028099690|nr:autotransporter-associated beta strand repeat-containing protein [Luteibacter sp.]MDQ7995239.1 autotransporter-associated beta strand repeat-containing protein [Luteibacter sp.]